MTSAQFPELSKNEMWQYTSVSRHFFSEVRGRNRRMGLKPPGTTGLEHTVQRQSERPCLKNKVWGWRDDSLRVCSVLFVCLFGGGWRQDFSV